MTTRSPSVLPSVLSLLLTSACATSEYAGTATYSQEHYGYIQKAQGDDDPRLLKNPATGARLRCAEDVKLWRETLVARDTNTNSALPVILPVLAGVPLLAAASLSMGVAVALAAPVAATVLVADRVFNPHDDASLNEAQSAFESKHFAVCSAKARQVIGSERSGPNIRLAGENSESRALYLLARCENELGHEDEARMIMKDFLNYAEEITSEEYDGAVQVLGETEICDRAPVAM